MSKFRIPWKSMYLIVPILILLATGSALAQSGGPANAEGGTGAPINRDASAGDDEVAGAQTAFQTGDEPGDGEGNPAGDLPDFNGPEIELAEQPSSPLATYFKRIAGSNFTPRDSTATFSYSGGGCMQRNSDTGDSWFTVDVQLPDGSTLDFLRVYYYDNDPTYDINSELWAFDGAGGTQLIAEADSTGTPGYSSTGSVFFDHTVDNVNESLVIVASIQGGVGANLRLCGIRLRYQYSFSTNFMPAILLEPTP